MLEITFFFCAAALREEKLPGFFNFCPEVRIVDLKTFCIVLPGHYEEVHRLLSFLGEDAVLLKYKDYFLFAHI